MRVELSKLYVRYLFCRAHMTAYASILGHLKTGSSGRRVWNGERCGGTFWIAVSCGENCPLLALFTFWTKIFKMCDSPYLQRRLAMGPNKNLTATEMFVQVTPFSTISIFITHRFTKDLCAPCLNITHSCILSTDSVYEIRVNFRTNKSLHFRKQGPHKGHHYLLIY